MNQSKCIYFNITLEENVQKFTSCINSDLLKVYFNKGNYYIFRW